MAVYWKYRLPAIFPGTYLTSISTISPGCLSALMYLYFIFLTLYLRVKPSCLRILPIVRTGTTKPSFANLQCNFRAQSLVFFLFVITLSLIQIGCLFWTSLRYSRFGFQSFLSTSFVYRYPSFQTPFAVWTYLRHIYQLHPLFRYRFYPPQTLFFNCFCHTYCHFPILGENRHKSLHITERV